MNTFSQSIGALLGLGVEPKELTFLQVSLRGVIVFIVTLVMVRLSSKRSLAEKTAFDAALIVIIASVLARAINGSAPFFPTLGIGFILVLLHRLLGLTAYYSHGFGILIKGKAAVLVGNGRSAALISKNGSLDWLCWPRFDSASIFGALIDPKIGGRWSICPASDSQMMRRYIENTNVLETTFSNGSGKIVLTDFMPVTSEEEKKGRLWPENELIRLIRCEAGEVPVLIDFDPRPNYGRTTSFIKDAGKLGWRVGVGTALLTLRSNIDLAANSNAGLVARPTLKSGDAVAYSLTFSEEGPAVLPPLGNFVTEKLSRTINWWQHWAARARYDGPYRKQVIRSALLLALLSYAPSGALVAAPSTSLPERIGGDLNWDYRFCWLRDAALAVRALFALGYNEDAEAFVSWLLHTTRLTRPCLHTLYDVYGNIIPRERALPHLSVYNSWRPVRLGNAATEQLQLDVYGEVIEAVSHFCCDEAKIDRETQNMLRRYGDYVCRHWYEPDNGMWESSRTR